MTTYVLGGGCFWCLDAIYRGLKGVTKVESGYAGGHVKNPTYEQVSTGTTGHAETVRVTFNESIIPGSVILAIYFLVHNPTTRDRQGADIGPQYRSIMLYTSSTQQKEFEAARETAQPIWPDQIVTEIKPLNTFYLAESEHQDFFHKNPEYGYCTVVIEPKIVKARREFSKWFKEKV
ncbi:MAG TPA: peptide-methionine (S)-S-oxide reductase MsrA [Candidatus Saccharimonadales bacterium]